MKPDKTVRKETGILLLGTLILCGVMCGVFALFRQFTYKVLTGALLGGLASVLIRDSCAAEGITDGHNGFVIDETPEAMASLLKRLCTDLPYMAQVGDHAMDEIYMSWETCVGQAYERYQEILEEK